MSLKTFVIASNNCNRLLVLEHPARLQLVVIANLGKMLHAGVVDSVPSIITAVVDLEKIKSVDIQAICDKAANWLNALFVDSGAASAVAKHLKEG